MASLLSLLNILPTHWHYHLNQSKCINREIYWYNFWKGKNWLFSGHKHSNIRYVMLQIFIIIICLVLHFKLILSLHSSPDQEEDEDKTHLFSPLKSADNNLKIHFPSLAYRICFSIIKIKVKTTKNAIHLLYHTFSHQITLLE